MPCLPDAMLTTPALSRSRSSANGGSTRSNLWPHFSTLLSNWSLDGRPFHLALVVYNHTSVVLEVDECTFATPPGFPLSYHHAFENLLPQLRLSLFTSAQDHVSRP